jgi:RNA polymerase sigma factor (TIGR02999 family)
MASDPSSDATSEGDRLFAQVYDELRRLAARQLTHEKPGQTLQPTALVHEAYLRLLGPDGLPAFRDRNHFFAAAATAMRRILVDRARSKLAHKHGRDLRRQPLADMPAPESDADLVALDEALHQLAGRDPVKAALVELRYFAGLTGDQAAAVLGVSPSTADRHWVFARAWLRRAVEGKGLPEKNETA